MRFTLERILNIWKDRKIYADERIDEFKRVLHATPISVAAGGGDESSTPPTPTASTATSGKRSLDSAALASPPQQQQSKASKMAKTLSESRVLRSATLERSNSSGAFSENTENNEADMSKRARVASNERTAALLLEAQNAAAITAGERNSTV